MHLFGLVLILSKIERTLNVPTCCDNKSCGEAHCADIYCFNLNNVSSLRLQSNDINSLVYFRNHSLSG